MNGLCVLWRHQFGMLSDEGGATFRDLSAPAVVRRSAEYLSLKLFGQFLRFDVGQGIAVRIRRRAIRRRFGYIRRDECRIIRDCRVA